MGRDASSSTNSEGPNGSKHKRKKKEFVNKNLSNIWYYWLKYTTQVISTFHAPWLASSEVNSTQHSPLSSWWEEIMHQKLNFEPFFGILKEINSLTSMSDQDRISPYNINTTSSRQVMRIKKNIILGIINWSNPKFSKLTSQELYSRQQGELLMRSWELKG